MSSPFRRSAASGRPALCLAFDRRTGELLEQIDVLVRRSLPGVNPGEVIDAIAYSPAVAPTIDTTVHPRPVTPVDGPHP
jgi:hypothetical protein